MAELPPDKMEHRNEIRNYFDLTAWQRARQLVKSSYEASRKFPREEIYGLTSQLRRAAVSIPSNIAEGYGRGTRKDYVHFLQIARGSLYELQTRFFLARDLDYMDENTLKELMSLSSEV